MITLDRLNVIEDGSILEVGIEEFCLFMESPEFIKVDFRTGKIRGITVVCFEAEGGLKSRLEEKTKEILESFREFLI